MEQSTNPTIKRLETLTLPFLREATRHFLDLLPNPDNQKPVIVNKKIDWNSFREVYYEQYLPLLNEWWKRQGISVDREFGQNYSQLIMALAGSELAEKDKGRLTELQKKQSHEEPLSKNERLELQRLQTLKTYINNHNMPYRWAKMLMEHIEEVGDLYLKLSKKQAQNGLDQPNRNILSFLNEIYITSLFN